ncbi:MAG: FAD/NAD(P)-binding oxidoreductase [bacterium]
MARALVLGGGFGGISAALELRRLLGAGHDVTLVDEGTAFRMGLGNLWLLDGRRKVGEGRRALRDLESKGIQVRKGVVQDIDVAQRSAVVDGETLQSDGLVVALGMRLAPEATPGFDLTHNVYDEAGAAAFAAALQEFRGGRLLIQVCGLPFKCPPAPYEAALIAADVLRRRGVKADIHLATPEAHPLPVAPPEFGGRLLPILEAAGITYHPNCKPARFVDGAVEWENGSRQSFDLAAAVPIHQAPQVIARTGLAGPSGFIPVDAHTMQTKAAGVYGVGDVAAVPLPNGKVAPKAGMLAEAQGRAAASHLARGILGSGKATDFAGRGTCFIELGNGQAIPAEGDFFAAPQPRFAFQPASTQGLQEKQRFEADRLKAWFGA